LDAHFEFEDPGSTGPALDTLIEDDIPERRSSASEIRPSISISKSHASPSKESTDREEKAKQLVNLKTPPPRAEISLNLSEEKKESLPGLRTPTGKDSKSQTQLPEKKTSVYDKVLES
jgi:hypothetical protein